MNNNCNFYFDFGSPYSFIAHKKIANIEKKDSIKFRYVPVLLGGLSSLPVSMRADFFGRSNFATIQGAMAPIHSLFSFIAPLFAAKLYEASGSYSATFQIFAALNVISTILILLTTRPVPPLATDKNNTLSQ